MTTDLTTITTPFGLLDEATQVALKAHNGEIEIYVSRGWESIYYPTWSIYHAYRARKEPVEDTVKHKGCAFQIGSTEPMISSNQHDGVWVQGVITTHRLDGKPVRIVWEADQ